MKVAVKGLPPFKVLVMPSALMMRVREASSVAAVTTGRLVVLRPENQVVGEEPNMLAMIKSVSGVMFTVPKASAAAW